jgi:hypothetical protein
MGDSLKDVRDRALLLLGFAGGFRRSELVGLDCADIEFVRQGFIITLRHSKTDRRVLDAKSASRIATPSIAPLLPSRRGWRVLTSRMAQCSFLSPDMATFHPSGCLAMLSAKSSANALPPSAWTGMATQATASAQVSPPAPQRRGFPPSKFAHRQATPATRCSVAMCETVNCSSAMLRVPCCK